MHVAGIIGNRSEGWLAVAVLALLTTSSLAQYPAARPGAAARPGEAMARPMTGESVQITELIGTGRRTLVKTPEYKTSIPKSSTRPKDWAQITVKFDSAPEWIDVLSMDFQVMAKIKLEGKDVYSIYHQTVEHVDVPRGRDHLTAVFLSPSAVLRYGVPVAVHVTAMIDGKAVAKADDVDPGVGPLPPNWWEDRGVLEKGNVTVRPDYLQRLATTPFALVNVDDYEVMR